MGVLARKGEIYAGVLQRLCRDYKAEVSRCRKTPQSPGGCTHGAEAMGVPLPTGVPLNLWSY